MVPISNNEEEDKPCCSFWISRQWYVTTPRNAGNRFSKQHSTRKAQSPFKLCSQKLEDSYTKINTSLAGRENITPLRMFSPFFLDSPSGLMQKLHEYIHPGRVSFLIYIYVHIWQWLTQKTEETHYIHSFPTSEQCKAVFFRCHRHTVFGLHTLWCLRIHMVKCNPLWKACLRDTGHTDLISLIQI